MRSSLLSGRAFRSARRGTAPQCASRTQSIPVQRPIWRAVLFSIFLAEEENDRSGLRRKPTRGIAMSTKLQLLLVALLVVVLIVDVSSAQRRRKYRRRTTTTEAPVQDEIMNMLEADEIAEEAATAEEAEVILENGRNEVGSKQQRLLQDPCMDKHCGAGRVCKSTEEGTAECVCVELCNQEVDPRRKVCTNYNETLGSDCEVYQARCFCDTGDARCRGPDYQHVHIVYYGECRQMPMCKEEDMADFPRRMRDWLFNIMRDLADRQELSSHYLKMQREAETNHTLRWSNAAIWKWCDLDGHPHDRTVSRHELFPIKAPLMALEHCIAPFLDSCDINNDHKITLVEWGKCLQLDEDDIEEKCDELAEANQEQY
ncbi:SPARC [Mycetomoellerius zeteki]|uniref:SPARC n=1 Tax=Mycetomoellerius zeteki TaxID=64791 RepID=UPI00084ECCF7|nr:PREDICTED: SPARC [Trachymyrmex zeteki]